MGKPKLAFFIMKFIDCLSEDTREAWPLIYRRLTGKRWKPPVKDERGITCETKIEDPEEIAKLMKEKPSRVI